MNMSEENKALLDGMLKLVPGTLKPKDQEMFRIALEQFVLLNEISVTSFIDFVALYFFIHEYMRTMVFRTSFDENCWAVVEDQSNRVEFNNAKEYWDFVLFVIFDAFSPSELKAEVSKSVRGADVSSDVDNFLRECAFLISATLPESDRLKEIEKLEDMLDME